MIRAKWKENGIEYDGEVLQMSTGTGIVTVRIGEEFKATDLGSIRLYDDTVQKAETAWAEELKRNMGRCIMIKNRLKDFSDLEIAGEFYRRKLDKNCIVIGKKNGTEQDI